MGANVLKRLLNNPALFSTSYLTWARNPIENKRSISSQLQESTWPRLALNLSHRYKSHDTEKWPSCFGRYQLAIINMDVQYQRREPVCPWQPISWRMASILRDTPAVVVVRKRPRAIRFITMRKVIDEYGAPLGGPSDPRSSAIN